MERFYSFSTFLKNKFNSKVVKMPLDNHISCPNFKNNGCIYCKEFSKSNVTNTYLDLMAQFENGKLVLNKKYPNCKYIAYFQTGSNTYMPLNKFKETVTPFLLVSDVVGISIATGPDCISDDYIEFFKELNKKTFLTIELGLQSSNDKTLKLINRGHDSKCFKDTVLKLHNNNIFTVAHIINGLPYETENDMLNTIKFLNSCKINGIKIHLLSILKDTTLAKIYIKKPFSLLSKDEYIDIVCKQIALLNKDIVIERLTGDPIKEDLIEPKWNTYKKGLLNDINKSLKENNIVQGMNQ